MTKAEFHHFAQTAAKFFIQVIAPMLRRKEAEILYLNGVPCLVKKRLDTKSGVCHTVLVGGGRHRAGVAGQGVPAANETLGTAERDGRAIAAVAAVPPFRKPDHA